MAKTRVKEKKNKTTKPDKEGLLADLQFLEKYGVRVKDCGERGIKIENIERILGVFEGVIVDEKGFCQESERVYPIKRGYKLYDEGRAYYLRPFKKP